MTKKLEVIIKKINPILIKHQIKRASIFGSFARGEENKDSDIDLLIELGRVGGLMAMGRLKMDLEDALKIKVDILTYRSVNHLIAPHIKKDEIKIYAKR
ncbi:MAG: nucleotidyltransferase domain-containing protein [Candidatus Falkowbacteria bacterium]